MRHSALPMVSCWWRLDFARILACAFTREINSSFAIRATSGCEPVGYASSSSSKQRSGACDIKKRVGRGTRIRRALHLPGNAPARLNKPRDRQRGLCKDDPVSTCVDWQACKRASRILWSPLGFPTSSTAADARPIALKMGCTLGTLSAPRTIAGKYISRGFSGTQF